MFSLPILAASLLLGTAGAQTESPKLPWRGADVSFVPQIESWGGRYFDGGKLSDPLVIMKRHGLNAVRIRIWENPVDGFCNLAATVKLAKRAKGLGLKFLLDFHYSDWWADPQHQPKPEAWKTLNVDGIEQAIHDTTAKTLAALIKAGATPDMVQIGNEIRNGLVWPEGHIVTGSDAEYDVVTRFVCAGLKAVRETGLPIRTMIHFDQGGNNPACRAFFDRYLAAGRRLGLDDRFDVIGLSYYPLWHGTPTELEANLADLSARYSKDVMVVETAYPWTFGTIVPGPVGERVWGDATKVLPEYPSTPEGQARYLSHLAWIVKHVPGGRGLGVMYWAPDWLDCPGHRSAGDNLNWFDFKGKVLPSINSLAL